MVICGWIVPVSPLLRSKKRENFVVGIFWFCSVFRSEAASLTVHEILTELGVVKIVNTSSSN